MKATVRDWDPVNYLTNEEDITSYLNAALEDGDPSLVAAAFGDVARARGMTFVAETTGKSRENLYRSLSEKGDPQISTLFSVADALGYRFKVEKADGHA